MNIKGQIRDQEINNIIKEYLKFNNFQNSLECFIAEIKTKAARKELNQIQLNNQKEASSQNTTFNGEGGGDGQEQPRLYEMMLGQSHKSNRELNGEIEIAKADQKYRILLEAARQIMSISIKQISFIESFNPNVQPETKQEELMKTVDQFKQQLCKYKQLVIHDGKIKEKEPMDEDKIAQLRDSIFQKLRQIKYKTNLNEELDVQHNEQNYKSLQDIHRCLIEVRINALSINPSSRKHFIKTLLDMDLFSTTQKSNQQEQQSNANEFDKYGLIIQLIKLRDFKVLQSLLAVISIMVSIKSGLAYLTKENDLRVISEVIDSVGTSEHGSVSQRFSLAILQKSSVVEEIIALYHEKDLPTTLFEMLEWAKDNKDLHRFCPDFASATLVNVYQSQFIKNRLLSFKNEAQQTIEKIQKYFHADYLNVLSSACVTHLLLCLSVFYSNEKFNDLCEQLDINNSVSQVVYFYTSIDKKQSTKTDFEIKGVLELCDNLFGKDSTEKMIQKELKGGEEQNKDKNIFARKERMEQYENENLEIVFECFKDEVN